MKNIIFVSSLLFLGNFCFADGLDNGRFEVLFRISDMGFSQIVTITNCTTNSAVDYYKFDVAISEQGSLMRFAGDRQMVKGIVYDGKFKFIIPYANVASLEGFYFEGTNQATNGVFIGNGDVPFQGPNGGENKFHFQIKKLSSGTTAK